MKNTMAEAIKNYGLESGYENCGIVPVSQMFGYTRMLQKRMAEDPESADYYKKFFRFAFPHIQYPWAKAIVICTRDYGKYHIPQPLKDSFGRFYLTDFRQNRDATDYSASIRFEKFLESLGLKVRLNRENGITGLRWAAMTAGLGIIRKNNFFYTQRSGSFVHLEGFLIDSPLELSYPNRYFHCPQDCTLCMNACRTKALAGPYTLNMQKCIACRTTVGWNRHDPPVHIPGSKWLYGCDDCQNACPYNYHKAGGIHFPGLDEFSTFISYESILNDNRLETVLYSKFPTIPKNKYYQWKINVLNVLFNNYTDTYKPLIQKALEDENPYVQDAARWISLKTSRELRA